MPTVEELRERLGILLEDGKPNPLNRFTAELVDEILAFLHNEFNRPFPQIQWDLRDGESYQERLRELGVREDVIAGSSGMYIGNKFSGHIVLDLGFPRQQILEGHVGSAMVHLVGMLIEEATHALFPKIMDKEMVQIGIRLTEVFLAPFKFTEEDKRALMDSVSGETKDGYFEPDFSGRN